MCSFYFLIPFINKTGSQYITQLAQPLIPLTGPVKKNLIQLLLAQTPSQTSPSPISLGPTNLILPKGPCPSPDSGPFESGLNLLAQQAPAQSIISHHHLSRSNCAAFSLSPLPLNPLLGHSATSVSGDSPSLSAASPSFVPLSLGLSSLADLPSHPHHRRGYSSTALSLPPSVSGDSPLPAPHPFSVYPTTTTAAAQPWLTASRRPEHGPPPSISFLSLSTNTVVLPSLLGVHAAQFSTISTGRDTAHLEQLTPPPTLPLAEPALPDPPRPAALFSLSQTTSAQIHLG